MSVHLAKGTRDHLPEAMRLRLAVYDKLRHVFEGHGFHALETPAFERIETLMGKYGDEGNQLIFKILKRGKGGERGECDQALRYDLTVPLARVIAMNPGLRMPFKRWQIAPVWRADRPARGRFREFVQCDCDIVGSESALADAECLSVAAQSLTALGFAGYRLRINHRALLRALASTVGAADRESELLVAIDKLDKIGRDGVSAELLGRGFAQGAIDRVWTVLDAPDTGRDDVLAHLKAQLEGDEVGPAVARLQEVIDLAMALGVPDEALVVDPTLARGLDYYTGIVYEFALDGVNMGSVGGGGRYDGLVGMFGKRDVPAVGLSLGIERLIVLLEEEGRTLPGVSGIDVTVTIVDDAHRAHAARTAATFRAAGLKVELVLEPTKLGKQFKHADAIGSRYVATVGPDEVAAGGIALKNLESGQQETLSIADAVARIAG
jgi:histidyl-tRNA synthetase